MTDNEQIIIDGVDIFDTLDKWADLISQNWCSDEYSTAEIIKNYILDINKQLVRKTQECEQLKEKYEALKLENQEGYEIVAELKHECEELKEENEELKAQRDTYANLMNVYRNISKGRQDSEIVIDYIYKLEKKLKIAEEALNDIKNSFFEDEDKEIITHAESIYYYSKAKEALQKMKEVK